MGVHGRLSGAALAVLCLADLAAAGQAPSPPGPGDRLSVLEVPFVAQSEALCGGAAAAMVLRYWGRRDVFAEDFAPLLEPGREGIRAGRLAAALDGRGFDAHVVERTRAVRLGRLQEAAAWVRHERPAGHELLERRDRRAVADRHDLETPRVARAPAEDRAVRHEFLHGRSHPRQHQHQRDTSPATRPGAEPGLPHTSCAEWVLSYILSNIVYGRGNKART